MAEYQQALAQMQKAKLDSSIQGARPCYGSGWACGLAAVLRGASEGISESTVTEKAGRLSNTSQTLSQPVYSEYKYQLVDISASKVARVDYYVIDVKKKQVRSSYFEIKDHEKFRVSYNVEQNDPNRSSILSNSQKEDDVTAWEKKPLNIKLSDLFDPKNLASAEVKPFTTVEAFIKPLSSRKYAVASPEYGKGTDPKTVVKGGEPKSLGKRMETKPSALDSGTIADERFDSVVIIKNAKSMGTGFYVTPDLIITAYHVVDKANLVEITFYDGTKTFGKVINHDVRLDLALIKAQVAGKPAKIHAGAIKLGETVEAIGHPKGFEFTITRGVVSALRKQSSAAIKSSALVEFVQTDTPISPGNSGGPLFLRDAVIGVNDWVRVDKASQNLNFSVSFNEIRGYLSRFDGFGK
jgi:S1-C subfamily serine protease